MGYGCVNRFVLWVGTLALAFLAGKCMSKIRMPAILGWLIVGMIFWPHAVNLMPQAVLDAPWYYDRITLRIIHNTCFESS